jgi:hypothetical protein
LNLYFSYLLAMPESQGNTPSSPGLILSDVGVKVTCDVISLISSLCLTTMLVPVLLMAGYLN